MNLSLQYYIYICIIVERATCLTVSCRWQEKDRYSKRERASEAHTVSLGLVQATRERERDKICTESNENHSRVRVTKVDSRRLSQPALPPSHTKIHSEQPRVNTTPRPLPTQRTRGARLGHGRVVRETGCACVRDGLRERYTDRQTDRQTDREERDGLLCSLSYTHSHAQNSWGPNWGMGGFGKIRRGTNEAGACGGREGGWGDEGGRGRK
jgi:hypothetical protein